MKLIGPLSKLLIIAAKTKVIALIWEVTTSGSFGAIEYQDKRSSIFAKYLSSTLLSFLVLLI